jgi:hypothetical protein
VRLADPVRDDFSRIIEADASLDVIVSGMKFGEGPVWNAIATWATTRRRPLPA